MLAGVFQAGSISVNAGPIHFKVRVKDSLVPAGETLWGAY